VRRTGEELEGKGCLPLVQNSWKKKIAAGGGKPEERKVEGGEKKKNPSDRPRQKKGGKGQFPNHSLHN